MTQKRTPKKVVKKKKKLVPIPKLKAKLWSLFSEFIRCRDADINGNIRCCTTGQERHWKTSQAGHFFSQRGNPALIFEESNVNAQSPIANKMQKNNITWEYLVYMKNKYGEDELNRLASLKGKPFKFTRDWYEEKIKHYKEQVELLKSKKNLK